MPICSVYGCPNYTANGFSMKHLPKSPEKRKLWMEKITAANPENFQLPSRICLCEVHFSPEMWQKNSSGSKKLKFNAIPNVFPLQRPENTQIAHSEVFSRSGTNCCVNGCTSRKQTQPSLHFFQFPKRNCQTIRVETVEGERKFIQRGKIWEKVLKMTKSPSSRMTVCSKHFRETDFYTRNKRMHLRPTAIPSLNLPIKNEKITFSDLNFEEREILKQTSLKNWIKNRRTLRFIDSIRTNSELKALTNLKTFSTFHYLVKLITDSEKINLTSNKKREVEEKVLVVLTSLKLNLTLKVVSFLFQEPREKSQGIFDEYLEYFRKVFKRQVCYNLEGFDWFETFQCEKYFLGFTSEGSVTFLTKSEEERVLKKKIRNVRGTGFERIEQELRSFSCLNGKFQLKEKTDGVFQVCLGLVNLRRV